MIELNHTKSFNVEDYKKYLEAQNWLNSKGFSIFFYNDISIQNNKIERLQSLVEELVEDGEHWLQVSEMLQGDVHGVLKIIQSTQYRKHVRLMKKVRDEK